MIDLQLYRDYEICHEPEGWPAIQMKEVTALVDEIEQLQARVKELEAAHAAALKTYTACSNERERLRAENAELRAEKFCDSNCTWLDHHEHCGRHEPR